jgi:hypothetical protein
MLKTLIPIFLAPTKDQTKASEDDLAKEAKTLHA